MRRTYIRFRAGLKAQGVEDILPVRGYFQPYSAWIATIAAIFTLIFSYDTHLASAVDFADIAGAHICSHPAASLFLT